MYFLTALFDSMGTSLFLGDTARFHGKDGIIGEGDSRTRYGRPFEGRFCCGVISNEGFLEVEVIFQEAIDIGGIKGDVTRRYPGGSPGAS